MRTYSLTHLSDDALLRDLASLVAQDRSTTAALLAHIAEVDERRLYLPAAYPSMYAYCVGELRLSEDAACNRIQAARVARQFPAIFAAVADGRLSLSGVRLLGPFLTPENAADLVGEASHRTRPEVEALLARRFPRSEALGLVTALPSLPRTGGELSAPGRIEVPGSNGSSAGQPAPGHVGSRSKLAPVAPERFHLEVTFGANTHDKLRYAQELLAHQLPSGDVAQVLDRALDALIGKLEKQKFAASQKPRRLARASTNPRHIPAQVKRAVWARDGGQCTFVSETGRRCAARKLLEFDHVDPVARGGGASVAGIRLRCRAHNQFEAECAFGAGFMHRKREAARRAAEARREASAARAAEVITPLRLLGFRIDEARPAAAHCEAIPDASLEERVRLALSVLRPPHARPAIPRQTC